MRLEATELFLMAARAAGRTVEPKVSIRGKIARDSDLSGTWTDATGRVSKKDFPSFKNDLEINLSQFSASRCKFTGLNIAWWESVIFSYEYYLEVKVEYIISGITAEPVPVFAGWIPKQKNLFEYERNEKPNTVSFEVWNYVDYADELYATTMLRQYIDYDVDGSGTAGLALPHIRDLFVTDANITDHVLKKGIHPISYQVSGGNKQAKVDDGEWVNLSTGFNTLSNGAGDQHVQVYAKASIPLSGEFTDDIIVDTPSDVLPKNWYYAVSARYLLKKLFEKAGITNVSFDTLEYPSADSYPVIPPMTGNDNPKISFMEFVADTESISASRTSVAYDGTYWWMGVDNKLYRRDVNGDYVLKQTLSAGYKIRRIIFNSRNGHLWLLAATSGTVNMDKIYVYIIGSDTMSTAATVVGLSRSESAEVIDYNYSGSNYKYALIFTDYTNGSVDEVTIAGTTLTRTTIYSGNPVNRMVYIKNVNEIYFAEIPGGGDRVRKMHVDNTGAWVDDGLLAGLSARLGANLPGAYNYTDDRIYYWDSTTNAIYMYQPGTSSESVLINNVDQCFTIFSDGNDNVYAIFHVSVTNRYHFAKIYGNVAHDIFEDDAIDGIGPDPEPPKDIIVKYGGLSFDGNTLWGVETYGRLFRYDSTVSLYIETADMEGLKIRGAIEKACQSFNLVYKISSTKSARVQRRSNEDGDPVTTGNSITLNSDTLRDITDKSFYADAYDYVRVSNGKREVIYDGVNYDAVVFDSGKVHPIDSDWIPDEILEDMAFNAYQYFYQPHKVYLAPSPTALCQYECLDGATIVHAGNMNVNTLGVIISDSIEKPPGGRPEFKILVNVW
ncbi:MAG: hypothetical protein HYV29_08055 [Ignavibacteriales bacterium]|nr:hypothetical protein [Ignavibacteriales bacterium]